ncbi:hypothetical protein HOLleu_20166 [Holothuria leucospilota]|uniref:Tesmin/TSO1-like CXC domain-containing protein n=1 Tax=Holothuria leucospilota TaxID=206669 RepID=A0A9Q1C148_HOLLE|nr:hypothetical protein HOLleu_20166 [Holothuria leucospilota]
MARSSRSILVYSDFCLIKYVSLLLIHLALVSSVSLSMPPSYCKKFHPDREPGPCAICKESKPRYWHIAQATSRHVQLVMRLREQNVGETDCVCQSCQKRLPKTPARSAGKREASNDCQIPKCPTVNDRVIQTSKTLKPNVLVEVFGIQNVTAIEWCTSSSGIFLCQSHYCTLTNRMSTTTCSLCLMKCRLVKTFNDLNVVKSFAQERLQHDVKVNNDSKLCNVCYQAITRYSKGPQYRDKVKSSKQHLSSLLQDFLDECSSSPTDSNAYALSQAMELLGSHLMDDQAILLEVVHDRYLSSYDSFCTSHPKTKADISQKKNKMQVIGIIKTAIGECIICSHVRGQPRLGTLIRRFGSDVLTALHKFQFKHFHQGDSQDRSTLPSSSHEKPNPSATGLISWEVLADDLQCVITEKAKSLKEERPTSSSFRGLSVITEIKKLPPFLWNFVLRSTLSDVEKKELNKSGSFNWNGHCLLQLHPSDSVHHRKMLRRLFICLAHLRASNDQFFSPFHLALSDVVDRYSMSSSACFQLLSAFGITVSKSTFQRFQTSIALEEMAKKPSLLSNRFTIASVDNIDRSSSYAAVSAGNADRGFHGTSVQAVEPFSQTNENITTFTPQAALPCSSRQVDPSTLNLYHQGSSCLPPDPPAVSRHSYYSCNLTIDSFSLSAAEEEALRLLRQKVFLYMFTKFICFSENLDICLPDFKTAISHFFPDHTDQSVVHFTSILAEPADNAETTRHVLDILYDKHGVGKTISHLVVAGDAKTYEHLLEAKRVYGEDLDWLLPYLGEWHLLKNVQAPLMKIYNDAGLRQLLGMLHKGATHTAVASASGFRKTHVFLIQSWEAMYRHQVSMFSSHVTNSLENSSPQFRNLYSSIKQKIQHKGSAVFQNLHGELSESTLVYEEFMSYFQVMGQADATSHFWLDFIHRDMFHYISLFLAIRLRQFDLRNAAVRKLTPIFYAMDRPIYLKLVPFHMAAMKQYPSEILEKFAEGAFAVSITGRNGSCVAFDEAHEMLINKEVKMAMTTTGMGSLSRLVHYLPFRAQLMKAFQSEVASSKFSDDNSEPLAVFRLNEDNVKCYIEKLNDAHSLFSPNIQPDNVTQIFTGEISSHQVSADLTTFYEKGEDDFIAYVKCVVLNTSGQKPPKRCRRNLKTFTVKKKTVFKQKQELKDHRMQIASLRRQIAFSKSSNQPVQSLMQFLCLPRAICTTDQLPVKASKASAANEYQKRYPDSFSSCFSSVENDPTCCYIVEGMFLINCPPLRIHTTFQEYANFLYRRWVQKAIYQFKAKEIHIVFDHPQRHGPSPKDIERDRRHSESEEALYTELLPETPCPPSNNWKKFLAVRSQKRLLVNFLSAQMLLLHSQNTSPQVQVMVIAGGFDGEKKDKAFSTENSLNSITEAPEYNSNHEEGDSRVWYHAKVTTCKQVVIYSPDRDTIHVGLPLMSQLDGKEILVQLRAAKGDDLFINMNSFVMALTKDLQLQKLGIGNLPAIPSFLQVVYICSGCDFTSFFKGHSKRAFLDVFYRDCEFITGMGSVGKLDDFEDSTLENGLLAFFRLIGSVYFRKYCSAFPEESPSELFNHVNVPSNDPITNHIAFLDAIREGHFHRISDESEWLPPVSALKFHWQRCCWVAQLWAQAFSSAVHVPDCTVHGWSLTDGLISVIWDTEENMKKVDNNQKMLRQGCKCTKGCSQNWCKCRKGGRFCSLFCLCKNCKNRCSDRVTESSDQMPGVATPHASEADEEFSDDSSDQSDEESEILNEAEFSVITNVTSSVVLDPMIELDEF